MARAISLAAAGFLLGIAATWFALHLARDAAEASSPLIENVPTMSVEAAESHRNSRYAGIRNIEETLALPGDFAQTEALYALAGRSDSAGVQDLIFQANRIADPSDRSAALAILFLRLTELDPRSALALSRTVDFRDEPGIETNIWHNWGKLALDQALAAAAALDSPAQRNLAAQALYAAYDYGGNETTAYIENALGIRPSASTRASYLAQLADRDPVEAVNVINAMQDAASRHQAAAHLGDRLGRLAGARAEQYAKAFNDRMARQIYTHSARSVMAETDPEAVLDEMLAGEHTMDSYSALQTLAARDIDKAMEYLGRIRNSSHRQMLASVVGQALAQTDPQRALAWAQENDPGMRTGLYLETMSAVAAVDPDLAMQTANGLPSGMQRQQAYEMAVMAISQQDPARAVVLLDEIEQREMRESIARTLAMVWVQTDPDAAMTWMMNRDRAERPALLSVAADHLIQMDLDSALEWLPRLDDESQSVWLAHIAPQIAMQRSIVEAQQFIRQFEGSDSYPQLLVSTIQGVAQVDISAAIGMADSVSAGPERDMLYRRLIAQYSHQDPQQAAAMLASISDEAQRSHATAMLVSQWSQYDTEAASQWTQDLPRGAARDDAITALVSNWDEMTPSRRLLVNSIGDPGKRNQAFIMHIQNVAQTNPQSAERLMNDLDLDEEERRQLLEAINMIGNMR
jgi:hypothetical protein